MREMTQTLADFRNQKHVALLEDRNFDKIAKIFAFEKKRYNGHERLFGGTNIAKGKAAAGKAAAKSRPLGKKAVPAEKSESASVAGKSVGVSASVAGASVAGQSVAGAAKDDKTDPDGEDPKSGAKLPFQKDSAGDQKTALAIITKNNLEFLLETIKNMYCEGVASNKRRALRSWRKELRY